MRLYRLTITVFGAYNERGLCKMGSRTTYRAFTAKGQALSEFNRQNKMLLENNHKYRLALAIVETLPNVAAVWIESIESETPAVKLIELIRDEALAPSAPHFIPVPDELWERA